MPCIILRSLIQNENGLTTKFSSPSYAYISIGGGGSSDDEGMHANKDKQLHQLHPLLTCGGPLSRKLLLDDRLVALNMLSS